MICITKNSERVKGQKCLLRDFTIILTWIRGNQEAESGNLALAGKFRSILEADLLPNTDQLPRKNISRSFVFYQIIAPNISDPQG